MPDDRRYRQQGYRGGGDARREPPRPPAASDAPRGGPMLAKRSVSRCAACGAILPITAESLEQCPNCRAFLHACRQCTHFDPGQRFECTQPIVERVADKNAVNTCASFALRVTVEREASPSSTRPDDARRGFGNLFKQ
jgi:hypothetical protein